MRDAYSRAEAFTAIAVGHEHAVALTGSGNAFAWGRNNSGQPGDGTNTNKHMPVAACGGITFGH
jgi:alpha-tubulin suppressor-like RCC1 family protein